MEDRQIVQEDLLTAAYSMFGFETIHNAHSSMPKFLKKCSFTYLRSDTVFSHLGKPYHEKTT